MIPSIETVWSRIVTHAGETFEQMRGGRFTYEVEGSVLRPDRTNRALPKSHFEAALQRAPLPDTTVVQDLQGPSALSKPGDDRTLVVLTKVDGEQPHSDALSWLPRPTIVEVDTHRAVGSDSSCSRGRVGR